MKAGGAVPSRELQIRGLHLKPSDSTVHQLNGEHKRLGVLFGNKLCPEQSLSAQPEDLPV